ncbi:uncharacterized protein C8Q71DRAFT_687658, partial [Rhodofomes roseus]
MLRTAKKYKASFAAVKLDKELKGQLPIWYHISATKQLRRLDNTRLSKCLRTVHGVITVADIVQAAHHEAVIEMNNDGADADCTCEQCNGDRAKGCTDPIKCRDAASRLLRNVQLKWDPSTSSPNDGLTLTRNRKKANAKAHDEKGVEATFDPSITERGGIAEAFRIFVDD